MAQDYAHALGARLRSIRAQQGLSLHGVEEKSEGRWKAVVVGSYERGDRAVTVAKLAELAEFYGVPVAELLPDARAARRGAPTPKLVIDLQRLAELPAHQAGPLARYAAAIQSQRGDYNGKVLTIRSEDLRSLAVIYDMTPEDLTEQLVRWWVLPEGQSWTGSGPAPGRQAGPPQQAPRSAAQRRCDGRDLGQHAVDEPRRVVGGQRRASSTAWSTTTARGVGE